VPVAGFVDTTVAEIDNRLDELKAEMAKLQAARSALTRRGSGRGSASAATPASSRRGGRRQTRSRSRRGGTRGDQALALVRERPGITIPDIAQSLGIEPNYLYRVMPNLVKSGQVKRDGQGWHPAEG
jgi:CRP-like cAMP-binding protein